MTEKPKKIIGRADMVDLPEIGVFAIHAKVDTGAKTSAIWASDIREKDGGLTFKLFDKQSPYYTGDELFFDQFERVVVASSIGNEQSRYKVAVLAKLRGKRIRTSFTLADRSQQAYPVLIGRNALRGKFLVDVQAGRPDYNAERQRSDQLQRELGEEPTQ
jgi:hypothetical protein